MQRVQIYAQLIGPHGKPARQTAVTNRDSGACIRT